MPELDALLNHHVMGGILERLELGPCENIQWQYLTVENLVALLDRKKKSNQCTQTWTAQSRVLTNSTGMSSCHL
jgi:hypothetical protein